MPVHSATQDIVAAGLMYQDDSFFLVYSELKEYSGRA